eukprot:TRINITY_DN1358_c0_g1_i3.p1 TRINITY_DN1358_c0_g1~~TRINITY_DN1358_c0_g1_i3.p1  ORF type:complete len:339 (-),score=79.21 TRINITY_DN1358_c0_g1_i3:195-1211(-)
MDRDDDEYLKCEDIISYCSMVMDSVSYQDKRVFVHGSSAPHLSFKGENDESSRRRSTMKVLIERCINKVFADMNRSGPFDAISLEEFIAYAVAHPDGLFAKWGNTLQFKLIERITYTQQHKASATTTTTVTTGRNALLDEIRKAGGNPNQHLRKTRPSVSGNDQTDGNANANQTPSLLSMMKRGASRAVMIPSTGSSNDDSNKKLKKQASKYINQTSNSSATSTTATTTTTTTTGTTPVSTEGTEPKSKTITQMHNIPKIVPPKTDGETSSDAATISESSETDTHGLNVPNSSSRRDRSPDPPRKVLTKKSAGASTETNDPKKVSSSQPGSTKKKVNK